MKVEKNMAKKFLLSLYLGILWKNVIIAISPKFTIIVAVPLIDHQWEAVGNDKIKRHNSLKLRNTPLMMMLLCPKYLFTVGMRALCTARSAEHMLEKLHSRRHKAHLSNEKRVTIGPRKRNQPIDQQTDMMPHWHI